MPTVGRFADHPFKGSRPARTLNSEKVEIPNILLIIIEIDNKNPALYAGFRVGRAVRRTGIEPVTLGLKALVSVCTN
jgi:hypothetical protein